MIVDCFSYCSLYGSELLLLRYHILKDYVDEFVVVESNHSHTGKKIPFTCKQKIFEWGLDVNKFKVIELHTPSDEKLKITEIDELNCLDILNNTKQDSIKSKFSRVRDRLSKDGILHILDLYDSDTIFLFSDIDEIINPVFLSSCANAIQKTDSTYLLIPLVYLEGRADLRVYNKQTNNPEPWDWAMFMCKKNILQQVSPLQIRSNKLMPSHIIPTILVDLDGHIINDMGWHFSWMGGKEARRTKKNTWCHSFDSFNWHINKGYKNSETHLTKKYQNGDIAPCGHEDLFLKDYSTENLPKEIFDLPEAYNFLFAE